MIKGFSELGIYYGFCEFHVVDFQFELVVFSDFLSPAIFVPFLNFTVDISLERLGTFEYFSGIRHMTEFHEQIFFSISLSRINYPTYSRQSQSDRILGVSIP